MTDTAAPSRMPTRCCTTHDRRRSTRWPTPRRARSRTAPRSARPARRRCSTPTGPARSWTCPDSRSCPPGSTTGSRSGSAASSSRRIIEPRLLNVVRLHLGPQVDALRPFPWQPKKGAHVPGGRRPRHPGPGVPAMVPLHRLRLPRPAAAVQLHQHPPVPARPRAVHPQELPRPRRAASRIDRAGKRESPAVPAQHLLTCTNGHLDEFPYTLWVHRGGKCPKAELPDLKMRDANVGKQRRLDDHVRLLRRQPRHGRSPGRRRPRQAPAEVPRPAPAPERLRRRLRRPPGADHDGRVQPVVRLHPVDHRDAAHRCRGEPRRSADRLRVELGVEQVQQFADQIAGHPRAGRSRSNIDADRRHRRRPRRGCRRRARARGLRGGAPGEARRLGSGRAAGPGVALPAEAGAVPAAAEHQRPDGHRDAARPELHQRDRAGSSRSTR